MKISRSVTRIEGFEQVQVRKYKPQVDYCEVKSRYKGESRWSAAFSVLLAFGAKSGGAAPSTPVEFPENLLIGGGGGGIGQWSFVHARLLTCLLRLMDSQASAQTPRVATAKDEGCFSGRQYRSLLPSAGVSVVVYIHRSVPRVAGPTPGRPMRQPEMLTKNPQPVTQSVKSVIPTPQSHRYVIPLLR